MKYLSLFLLAGILFAGCSSSADSGPVVPNTDIDPKFENNISTLFGHGSKNVNNKASDIIWKDSLGRLDSLSGATKNGEIVLLNFWATWCTPCNDELPDLKEVADSMTQFGVRVIGVSVDYGSNIWDFVKFDVDKFKLPYQIVIDPKYTTYQNYGGDGSIPRSYIIDRNGNIRFVFVGQGTKADFIDRLWELL
ncbi:MAG TPA: TlpA disulfide reductase family protein [Candidatus Kapabacteria bacterium]|nr:TlpA disulfide reductase family protein [Candidatus Kapabacteria bacterium]